MHQMTKDERKENRMYERKRGQIDVQITSCKEKKGNKNNKIE